MACEVRLSVRALVEFVWRHGSIDSRFSGFDRRCGSADKSAPAAHH